MAQRVLLQAVMEDGTIIRDEARTFEDFTALALGFRRDPDVAQLTWTVLLEPPAPPEPVLYEHSGQCPWHRSNDLDEELWDAQARDVDLLHRHISELYWREQEGK